VVYLTVDGVIVLHGIALELHGGLDGIRSQQMLASAVAQAEASAFGEDAYKTIPEKAAAYGFFIAENQPFIDGNKRTALLAMETFLLANGYELTEDNDAIAQAFEDLGGKVIDQSEFFGWVSNHARPIPGGESV
jgi:death-on-curing protein